MMDSMETVLGAGLGDVETDTMSPLDTPELEHDAEAAALEAVASMGAEEDDDVTGVSDDAGSVCVSSVSDGGILIPTDAAQSITSDGVIGLFLQTSDANGVALASGMKLSVSGMLPEGAVISTEAPPAVQAVTMPDGSTAFIQQPKEGKLMEGQAVQLEDGTTAFVQGSGITPKVELEEEEGKGLESATAIQLEDGTTAFLHSKVHEGLQAIQFEDGTTALIHTGNPGTDALLSDGAATIDAATLESLSAQLRVVGKNQMTMEKALAIGEKAYKCQYEECGRLYTTLHHLRVHERSHTGDRPFKCDYDNCGKAFATGYGLKSHTRVHTGEKPYPCTEEGCDKAFKTSGDLQKHVRTHTGERPFKCPFEGCERSFTTSNIRKVHIRTHTGERPYLCTEDNCGRAFASATNYKNHVRIHTGEKPYVCTVQGCGKRFTEYSSLYKHHVVHTHSKPYTCSYCSKTYRQTSTLAMHKRTAHGEGEECTGDTEAQIFARQQENESGEPVRKKQKLKFSMSGAEAQPLGAEEGESTLVINTADAQQVSGGMQVITDLHPDAATGLVTVPLKAFDGMSLPSFTVSGEHGQQVLVVTDPSQLEMLQQLAQQHLESSASSSSASASASDQLQLPVTLHPTPDTPTLTPSNNNDDDPEALASASPKSNELPLLEFQVQE